MQAFRRPLQRHRRSPSRRLPGRPPNHSFDRPARRHPRQGPPLRRGRRRPPFRRYPRALLTRRSTLHLGPRCPRRDLPTHRRSRCRRTRRSGPTWPKRHRSRAPPRTTRPRWRPSRRCDPRPRRRTPLPAASTDRRPPLPPPPATRSRQSRSGSRPACRSSFPYIGARATRLPDLLGKGPPKGSLNSPRKSAAGPSPSSLTRPGQPNRKLRRRDR